MIMKTLKYHIHILTNINGLKSVRKSEIDISGVSPSPREIFTRPYPFLTLRHIVSRTQCSLIFNKVKLGSHIRYGNLKYDLSDFDYLKVLFR